jgi:hypothetical protein
LATHRYARTGRAWLVTATSYKSSPTFSRRREYVKGVTEDIIVDISAVTDELKIICDVKGDLADE